MIGISTARKNRPISKGLRRRVAFYIRDNAINGVCSQEEETIAYHLGLTVETVHKVIEQLKAEQIIIEQLNENPLLPKSYIYIGEGTTAKKALALGQLSERLNEMMGDKVIDETFKDVILDYDAKVRELLYDIQKQSQELEDYKSFKDSIMKVIDTEDGLVHILARRRP